ncbi:hypothetical protein B0T22DRAFT_468383 [Podospora appendiculata]|uniref:Secreted protein n=1 Tax=Podospora appendiculata TaxID=314037 RepID=A0AAE0X2I9_9PEZI|nr:hypothetical protein B0T22DRAFT_468383 [Podospora appendiculata]
MGGWMSCCCWLLLLLLLLWVDGWGPKVSRNQSDGLLERCGQSGRVRCYWVPTMELVQSSSSQPVTRAQSRHGPSLLRVLYPVLQL